MVVGGSGRGVGGRGRGHFIHPAIYCTSTWCFALKGLRTTICKWSVSLLVLRKCVENFKAHDILCVAGAEQRRFSGEAEARSLQWRHRGGGDEDDAARPHQAGARHPHRTFTSAAITFTSAAVTFTSAAVTFTSAAVTFTSAAIMFTSTAIGFTF